MTLLPVVKPLVVDLHVTRELVEVPPSFLDPWPPMQLYVPGVRSCSLDFETHEDLLTVLGGVHPCGQKLGVYDWNNDVVWDGYVRECYVANGLWSVKLSGCVPRNYKHCWLCKTTTKFITHGSASTCSQCDCYTEEDE